MSETDLNESIDRLAFAIKDVLYLAVRDDITSIREDIQNLREDIRRVTDILESRRGDVPR